MEIFKTSQLLVKYLSKKTRPLGMVPTMGALHLGHLSLIKRALKENKTVLVSIFVNPIQFDSKNDLENYPININQDLLELRKVSEKIIVYIPKVDDVFDNITKLKPFDLAGLDNVMEGKKRAGHFQGVTRVVVHFFKTFAPDFAYFGEKDFQQLMIIDHISRTLELNTKIIGCPIIRENDGLAMSSRNSLLTSNQRKLASKLFECLQLAKSNAKKIPYSSLKTLISNFFEKNEGIALDYFMVANPKTLKEFDLGQPIDKGRSFVAATLGKIRLIDNLDIS